MIADCYCDYDPPTIWRPRKPKARKRHACYECGAAINPGDQYEYVFSVYDGYAGTYHTCQRCYDLRQWVQNNVPCFCWAHGNMHEDAKNAVDDAVYRAPAETVGLRFGFLRRREGHVAAARLAKRRPLPLSDMGRNAG